MKRAFEICLIPIVVGLILWECVFPPEPDIDKYFKNQNKK